MKNTNTSKQENSNRNLLLLFVSLLSIGLTSFVWWYFSKPMPQVITKGTFPSSKVTPSNVKPIPVYVYRTNEVKIDKTAENKAKLATENFKILYGLSQKDYDSLLVQNNTLDSLAMATNDKYYQQLYANGKFIEFSHVFDNDTLKATVSGITRGAPKRLKLDWELKLPKPKEPVFRLSAGGLFAASKTLSNPTATAIISGQFKSGSQVLFGYDTNGNILVGGTVSVFGIKR